MQARTAAAFMFGFGVGMAVLAIGLWSTGHLVVQQEVATATSSSAPQPVTAAFREPSIEHGERKQPLALPGPLPAPLPAPAQPAAPPPAEPAAPTQSQPASPVPAG